jgi:hypothetical protein
VEAQHIELRHPRLASMDLAEWTRTSKTVV